MSQKKDEPIVVISGMSGRFPGVNSVADYAESLYNKKELVGPTKGRFPTYGLFEELPDCIGRVEDFEKFDFDFFNIKPELAKLMDPMAKKMLEVAVEGILDAGLSLDDITTNRTGLYSAHIYSDFDRTLKPGDFVERQNNCSDPSIVYYRQLYHEWVAYCLNITGPTYHYESACSSAMYAISDAFKAIQIGLVDTAIVITANLNIVPNIIIEYFRLGIMSKSGVCRFADANADGYIKSEAACCLVLQRYDPNLSDVKRIYSRIANTKCNSDGFKLEGITFPKSETQYQLIKETFEEVGLEPTQVNYIETHGTGTQKGDIQELCCIDQIFNDEVLYSKRRSQLYVGSVKSNIGHTEASSGLCSVIKSLFCFMYDKIPPVINHTTPNPNIPALLSGRIKVVCETIPLNTDLISISCFGFGGSNTHVILQNGKSIPGIKDNHLSSREFRSLAGYQLINLAARSEQSLIDGLHKLAHQFRLHDINLNEIYLLNDVVYREQIKLGFNHTGHIILNLNDLDEEPAIHQNKEFAHSRNVIDYHQSIDRRVNNNKLFYAVPGLGCQWDGMSIGLLDIPFFERRLKELCMIIQPELDFDIYKLMLSELDSNSFDFNDSIFCLVAVAIYQISLLDLLKEIGLQPDGYFGHSFGELICAYSDNICTAKQVLEATIVVCKLKQRYDECDKQNKPINNFLFEKGQMAVVGLSWEQTLNEIKQSKVQKVNAACNNSIDCVTVSGGDEEIGEFLTHLTAKGIFNRRIASCGMAFHCDLVKEFYDYLLLEFSKIFKNQVKRSSKWISTSMNPFSEQESVSWLNDDPTSNRKEKQTFGEYFANCILKPVLFKESCEKMISDLNKSQESIDQVFVLEIAPRSFLTSLMKSNTSKCTTPLTYLPGFSIVKKANLYDKPNTNLQTLLNIVGILNGNEIYSSLPRLYRQYADEGQAGSTNGCMNGHLNQKMKTKQSSKSSYHQPLITNRLPLSSFVMWDHTVDIPVPAYPEFFNFNADQTKIDLNTSNYRYYLPDKSSRSRLPISFYLAQVINQFEKKNNNIQFTTVHIQDLIVYRLEELCQEELECLSIEQIEFNEHSSLGQIYMFLIRNHANKVILRGNLAVSAMKLGDLDLSDKEYAQKCSSEEFYKQLNCVDSRYRLIENSLLISKEQITAQSTSGKWTDQLESLIQLFAYFDRRSIVAEIDRQTLQIHAITIQLESDESKGEIIYNNQLNIARSKQVELKCIQLNSLNADESRVVIDENNNIEFKNKKQLIDQLSKEKISVKYFKANSKAKNLSFIGHQPQPVLGLLDKNDKLNKNNCWPVNGQGLSYLSLLDSYLIASDLLNRQCKSNYELQSAFLNCEQNFGLLIAFCDLLHYCDLYVLLKDQTKIDLIKNCFSTCKNLHILITEDPSKDDFDLDLLRVMNGEGTHLVVAQADSDRELNKSLNCLSFNGKLIHLNNESICVTNQLLGMALFLKNIDFKGITLSEINLDEIVGYTGHLKVNSILSSINPTIIQTLDHLNQFELEKLFNINLIQNL